MVVILSFDSVVSILLKLHLKHPFLSSGLPCTLLHYSDPLLSPNLVCFLSGSTDISPLARPLNALCPADCLYLTSLSDSIPSHIALNHLCSQASQTFTSTVSMPLSYRIRQQIVPSPLYPQPPLMFSGDFKPKVSPMMFPFPTCLFYSFPHLCK